MILDSEDQRELLLNCINSASLAGMVAELMPQLMKVAELIEAVQKATVEEVANGE